MKILFVILLITTGCQIKNSGDELQLEALPKSNQEPLQKFSTRTIGLRNLQQTALKDCLNCHLKNPTDEKPLLITVADWRSHQDKVLSEIADDNMPPIDEGYTLLPACEKALIRRWFELGAPENSDIRFGTVADCSDKKD